MLLLKFWYIIIIRVAVYINHAIVFWIYLFCGIDFVFSGLGFSGTAKGKPEKPRCHFIFVIELPVSPFLIEFGHMVNQHKIPNKNKP